VGCRLRRAHACCGGGQVVKIKDGIVNLQAFIMIRGAGAPGFAPSVQASLGMIEESGRGAPSLSTGQIPFMNFVSVVDGS
jgi:hypothetical protein